MLSRIIILLLTIPVAVIAILEFVCKLIFSALLLVAIFVGVFVTPFYWVTTSKRVLEFYDLYPDFPDMDKMEYTEVFAKTIMFKPFYKYHKDDKWFQNMFPTWFEETVHPTEEERKKGVRDAAEQRTHRLTDEINHIYYKVIANNKALKDVELTDPYFDETVEFYEKAIKKFKDLEV